MRDTQCYEYRESNGAYGTLRILYHIVITYRYSYFVKSAANVQNTDSLNEQNRYYFFFF